MDWEKATRLAYAIGRSKLAEQRVEFFRAAAGYARLRAEWQLAPQDGRIAMNPARTEAHDSFIRACDKLEQVMREEGEDVSWRADLGYDRKEIGDFACYVNLILGLAAR
ncbi:MAG: hypothetical protein VB050_12905 [Geobacteraceae bacterium]|nr:hypothetical protein [Geobacteraceae bacterium]